MDTETLMKDIVLSHPAVARRLDALPLNYCCDGGGKLSLACACQAAGLDADVVLAQLRQAEARPAEEVPAEFGSARDLIGHLLATHHAYTRRELARLETVLNRLVERHGETRPELAEIRRLFSDLRDDLLPHLLKEENVLFPYIETLERHAAEGTPPPPACFGVIDNPLRQMNSEHKTVQGLLGQLRQTTQGYTAPADACPSYKVAAQALQELEADLLRHIQLEAEVLFPKARELAAA